MIDLSLVRGVPSFLQTLEAVLGELVVESCVLADEMEAVSPDLRRKTLDKPSWCIDDVAVAGAQHLSIPESAHTIEFFADQI